LHAHFWEKMHSFKICALKKRNFRQLKSSNFRVEKCKTEENLSPSITLPIRLWLLWRIVLWKESLCKTWIVFILIKCICFIIKINHVWSRVKNIGFFLKKPIVFPKKPLFSHKTHCFPTCALFYPIVLKQKIITDHIIFLPAARSSFCSCPPVSFLIASVYSSGDSTSLWVVLILWNMDRAAKRIFFSRLEVFAHQITSSLLSSVTPAVHVRTVFHVLN